jgi:DNA invertase Pin-like site-specific DNA recombinase
VTPRKTTRDRNSTEGLALLYVRVSTSRQADEGMSLDAQEDRLRAQAAALGYSSVRVVREEGRSGKSIKGRPAMVECLELLNAGEAVALIGAKLDRISRNTRDLLAIVDAADKHQWRLVVLDVNLDTATPVGRMVLTILEAVAEMERNRIAERQADSHAERRRRGQVWGVTHGPRSELPSDVRERIVSERGAGGSLRSIAAGLNTGHVPTVRQGARWHPSTIAHVLASPSTVRGG